MVCSVDVTTEISNNNSVCVVNTVAVDDQILDWCYQGPVNTFFCISSELSGPKFKLNIPWATNVSIILLSIC